MENTSNPKLLSAYCKRCHDYFEVPKEKIFSDGEFSKYATRCPVCNFGRALPFKEVEKAYGNLEV